MKVSALPKIAGVIAIALIVLVISLLATQWRPLSFGGYEVRQNRLTGIAQVKDGDRWKDYQDDPYSTGIDAVRLADIRLSNVAWGPDGLLCVRATNRSSQPFQGRIAFRIVERKLSDNRALPDRTLRVTVNIAPNQTIPLLIRTNLPTPDLKKMRIRVDLQPVNFSGM